VTDFVLDASVAVKWFLPPEYEQLSEEAIALYRKFVQREIQFVIPDLFWADLGSAFWKAIRLGRFQKSSADEAITYLLQSDLPTYSTAGLLGKAFHIATMYDRSVYDSLYVALAIQTNLQLITADERLANALAARFPVKWLGAV
jgi:predicted nucleic acid-binding protein